MTLTPRLNRLALFLAEQELRTRKGEPVAPRPPQPIGWEAELVRALELEVATSATGSRTACRPAQSDKKEPIGVDKAAEILRCTTRFVRQIAPELGGVKVSGRWLLDEDEVIAYQERLADERRARIQRAAARGNV